MSERGPYAKGVARRQEILDTALRVLAQAGYRKTSLRAIGRELDIQPAHILHYFSSREDLLQAVITGWDLENGMGRSGPETYIENWIETVRRNTTIPGLVHLYTAFAAESADDAHPSREFFRARFERLRTHIALSLDLRQRAGLVRPEIDTTQAATMLIGLSDGLQLQWLIDRSVDMPGQLQAAVASLGPSA